MGGKGETRDRRGRVMRNVLLVFGADPRRRHRYLQKPLEAVGINCELVEDAGRGLAHCPEMRAKLRSREWSSVVIFGGDIRIGVRIAEARRWTNAPVVLRFGGDPFATRWARSREWVKRGRLIIASRSVMGLYRTKRALSCVDGVIAVGPGLLKGLLDSGAPGISGVVAPPVIDLPTWPVDRVDVDPRTTRILTISNFAYRSKSDGIDVLAEGVKRAANQLGVDVLLDVLGGGLHAEQVRARWEGRYGRLEVRCHGFVEDVSPFFRSASIFAYCSTLDAFGLAILEAQGYGLPVMVNAFGYSTDFLKDGEDAVMFDADDVDSARDVASRLISSSELREELGRRARDSAVWRNDAKRIGEELLKFIDRLSVERGS